MAMQASPALSPLHANRIQFPTCLCPFGRAFWELVLSDDLGRQAAIKSVDGAFRLFVRALSGRVPLRDGLPADA